jgi:hypothetical protein
MGAAHLIQPPLSEDRLYSCCLFCGQRFPTSPLFGRVPPGVQLAYDPAKSRLWSICSRCRRWNLIPAEERFDAIEELERTVRGRATLLAASDHIRLYAHDELQIVRIGGARLVERASWRYGSLSGLAARATASVERGERFAATAVDAVERLGTVPGLRHLTRHIDAGRALDMVRWSRFGSVAWDGRAECTYCRSVLHALHFDISWWLYPRIENGRLIVGVPCTRCDPWSPAKVFDVKGDDAHLVLRRVLAYQHVGAGRERSIRDAASLVRTAGSAERLLHELSTGTSSLWRLGAERRIALTIALDHLVEQRMLELRIDGIEAEWRVEEELAQIIDEELS